MTDFKITQKEMGQFMGMLPSDIGQDEGIFKVSLFVVSSKGQYSGIKQLNFDGLSQEKRAEKLKKYAQEMRFVAVVEIGDTIFVNVRAQYAKEVKSIDSPDLSHKSFTIQELTDDQAAQLGEVFEKYLLPVDKENLQKDEKESEKKTRGLGVGNSYRKNGQSEGTTSRVSSQMLIQQMVKNDLGKIITNCMKKYADNQREEKLKKEADDQAYEIKRSEIRKQELKKEIKDQGIKEQEQANRIVKEGKKKAHGIH